MTDVEKHLEALRDELRNRPTDFVVHSAAMFLLTQLEQAQQTTARLSNVIRTIRQEAETAYESDDEDVRVSGGAVLFVLKREGVWLQKGHAMDDRVFDDEGGESNG